MTRKEFVENTLKQTKAQLRAQCQFIGLSPSRLKTKEDLIAVLWLAQYTSANIKDLEQPPVCPFCDVRGSNYARDGEVLICKTCAREKGERAALADHINCCDW